MSALVSNLGVFTGRGFVPDSVDRVQLKTSSNVQLRIVFTTCRLDPIRRSMGSLRYISQVTGHYNCLSYARKLSSSARHEFRVVIKLTGHCGKAAGRAMLERGECYSEF
jgi:hypothetical protein